MVHFGVAATAIIVTSILAYIIGYRACNENWKNGLSERVNKMVDEKIGEVRALYDETYRNILRHLVEIIKEETNNDGQE